MLSQDDSINVTDNDDDNVNANELINLQVDDETTDDDNHEKSPNLF